jgi:hypothetical protein
MSIGATLVEGGVKALCGAQGMPDTLPLLKKIGVATSTGKPSRQ